MCVLHSVYNATVHQRHRYTKVKVCGGQSGGYGGQGDESRQESDPLEEVGKIMVVLTSGLLVEQGTKTAKWTSLWFP